MTLWILLGLMTLVAMGFALRPMLTDLPRLTLLSTGVIVVFAALSAGLYWYKGNPGVPSGAGRAPDIQQMVTSLAARLERQPDDANGWKMLGRSYMTLGDPPAAVEAFRKAVELESAQNA
ncbi:MAG: tetratricopeptide repeat protein [Woeseiaceae bacterium]